jgi:hypothetical protein
MMRGEVAWCLVVGPSFGRMVPNASAASDSQMREERPLFFAQVQHLSDKKGGIPGTPHSSRSVRRIVAGFPVFMTAESLGDCGRAVP